MPPAVSPSGVYLRKNARRKYEAILNSACRLFLKHGYTHTSMDAIALDAGVSKQTVYSYFTNKDVLFCQMIEAECARHAPPPDLLADPDLDPEEALFSIGRGFIDTINGYRGLAIHRLVLAEAGRHPRIAQLFFESGPKRMQSMMIAYLERQVQLGHFDIENYDHAAEHFFSLVRGRYHLRMSLKIKPAPSKKELDDHVHEVVALFFRLYSKQRQAQALPVAAVNFN